MLRRQIGIVLLGLGALLGSPVHGQTTAPPPPQALTVENALTLAITQNPDLAVARKNRGIAEAGIIIGRTYPFNPIWQNYLFGVDGPADFGIRQRFASQNNVRLDLELRGQGQIRQAGARATLSRVEWETANQELLIGVRTIRAFNTLLYRQEKLGVVEEGIRVQEDAVVKTERLVNQGQLKPADLLLIKADLVEAHAAIGPARALAILAWTDLRRLLGVEGAPPPLAGRLDACDMVACDGLENEARRRRPDVLALQMVVEETEQRLRLEVANRWGNPSIGPAVNTNESGTAFVGSWLIYQIPVFNTRRGDILQRHAERDRAVADARRLELQVTQDVQAARERLDEARKWVDYYAKESFPTVRAAAETLSKLFAQGEPGIDVARVVDAQRRLLRVRDAYLDALWELSQARADLAAAAADFNLALSPPPPPTVPRAPAFLAPVASE